MNTYPHQPQTHGRRLPGRTTAIVACLLVVALLLAGGAGWTVQAAPLAQKAPPRHLPYDGPFALPQLEGAAPRIEAAPALTAPEYVSWSKLVFQSARNEHDWEIFAAQGDGSNQANISNHGSMDLHPRLNRGATRVVFASNRHGGYDLFTMNPDGGGQTQIVGSTGDDVYPAWSPDGSRIAFQAYRDGQAEIYVANVDGSGQTRLTSHGDYDGQPAWSPDGSQIAFVRRESGSYRIWVMNANGSNQRPLSNQAYSENPAWSPDGSQIAYDADGNGDGWQEIWLMNADGSNQREVYNPPESETDAWVGSWSPDGRYVAFTRISFVYYQGQWYWTSAYLDAWDSTQPGNTLRLSGNGADWNPGWASTDGQAPTSSVQPLPAQSPATFTVRWTGSDTGGAGLKNYDVQIRDSAGGTWTNWKTNTTDTSASYTGVGGRAYYFRARARDHAGNVEAWPATHDSMTTVESSPPQTAVFALAAFSRNGLVVEWGGSDPGGSGILSYDVQYRQGNGAWTDWRLGVTETSATFSGAVGSEYRFRSRARDRAQNLEAWPAAADAATTLYTWAVTGNATDNRGAPVAGMAVTTAPAAFHAAPSDGDGAYAARVATAAASYSASWSKSGYGALPSTAFAPNPDAAVDVVLPPADNVVLNWGFENGSMAWQFGGSLTAAVTSSDKHSGVNAAFLGSGVSPLRSVRTLAGLVLRGFSASSFIDSSGVIHAVWAGQYGEMSVYSSKRPGQAWSNPELIPGSATDLFEVGFSVVADQQGVVHIVWTARDGLYYIRKEGPFGWSTPERIPGSETAWFTSGPELAVASGNVLKVAWPAYGTGGIDTRYNQRGANGAWGSPKVISSMELRKMATDPSGYAHLLMDRYGAAYGDCHYASEAPDSTWSVPIRLSGGAACYSKDIAIDALGTVHVVFSNGAGVFYRNRSVGRSWSETEQVSGSPDAELSLTSDVRGTIHLLWVDHIAGEMRYASRTNKVWSASEAIGSPSAVLQDGWGPQLVVDASLRVHALWKQYSGAGMRYVVRDPSGRWSTPVEPVGVASFFSQPSLLIDAWSTPHVLWTAGQGYSGEGRDVMYAGPEPLLTAGEANMSQAVQVPAAAIAPTLSFLHRFSTEFPSNSRLEVVVDDGVSPTVVFSATTGSNIWTHPWEDLTPWAGRSVTLRFRVIEEAGGSRARAYIDEVTAGSAHPDAWVSLPAQLAAAPDRAFDTTISYGNRGGVTASGGQVTLRLPAELSFVSADPPPSATTPTLRWDVGTLAGQSGPEAIRVTLQVAASATGGDTLTTTASIISDTAELEQANNTAAGAVYVGSALFLPVLMK